MKIVLILAAALLMTGCDTLVKREVVTKNIYIVRKAIDDQKRIPPYPPAIDVSTANQLELAEWIAASEKRQWDLEGILAELIKFYEKPVTTEEQKAATPEAPKVD